MAQCKATKQDGTRCKNNAAPNKQYCHIHLKQKGGNTPALAIGGALLGNIIIPGVGGAIAGAIIGGIIGASSKNGGNDE